MQFGMVVLDTYDTVIVPVVLILLTAYLIGRLLYQLVTGKALSIFFNGTRLYELVTRKPLSQGTLFSVRYSRDEKPAQYWVSVGIDSVIIVVLFFMTRCFLTLDCDPRIWGR